MSTFEEIAALADQSDRMFDRVAQELVARGELHRLFDLRLAQKRLTLDVAVDGSQGIDDVAEPLRSQLETGYLAACREVGSLLLEVGQFREAWTYLRPAGDKHAMRERLARAVLDDQQAEELIELALYEAVDPERGFAWLLARNGVCNAITALDSLQHQLSLDELAACASSLVRHVYGELQGNLRGHLRKIRDVDEPELTVAQFIQDYPELLADGSYHLDPSHLASTVRFARVLAEPSLLQKAIEMAEYGARLPEELQYPGEPPFEDAFPTHQTLLRAFCGEGVEPAITYFRQRAIEESEPETTTALEAYLVLLDRVGQPEAAMRAYAELAPRDRGLSRHAPALVELAKRSGAWTLYDEVCRERDDLLGFAIGRFTEEKLRKAT